MMILVTRQICTKYNVLQRSYCSRQLKNDSLNLYSLIKELESKNITSDYNGNIEKLYKHKDKDDNIVNNHELFQCEARTGLYQIYIKNKNNLNNDIIKLIRKELDKHYYHRLEDCEYDIKNILETRIENNEQNIENMQMKLVKMNVDLYKLQEKTKIQKNKFNKASKLIKEQKKKWTY